MKKEEPKKDEQFYTEIRQIIETARTNAIRSVDFSRVQMYWLLGKRIFEEEQQGKDRADYGAYLIRNLAEELTPLYGSGFSVRQLEQSRRFYRMYPIGERGRGAGTRGVRRGRAHGCPWWSDASHFRWVRRCTFGVRGSGGSDTG